MSWHDCSGASPIPALHPARCTHSKSGYARAIAGASCSVRERQSGQVGGYTVVGTFLPSSVGPCSRRCPPRATYPRYRLPASPAHAQHFPFLATATLTLQTPDPRLQTPDSNLGQLPDLSGLCLSAEQLQVCGLQAGGQMGCLTWSPIRLETALSGSVSNEHSRLPTSLFSLVLCAPQRDRPTWRCHHKPRRSGQIRSGGHRVCSRVQPRSPQISAIYEFNRQNERLAPSD